MGSKLDSEINVLEYQLELQELLTHLAKRLENLIRVYEEANQHYPGRLDHMVSNNDLSLVVELLGSLVDPSQRFRNSRPIRRIRLLDGDPPCLIDGKFQDKLICDECRRKYPILTSLLERLNGDEKG